MEQQGNSGGGNGNSNPANRKSPTEQQNVMPPGGVIMPLLDAPTAMSPQMIPQAPPVNRDPRTAAQQHQQQQQQQQMMMGAMPGLLGAPPPGLSSLLAPGKYFSVLYWVPFTTSNLIHKNVVITCGIRCIRTFSTRSVLF